MCSVLCVPYIYRLSMLHISGHHACGLCLRHTGTYLSTNDPACNQLF